MADPKLSLFHIDVNFNPNALIDFSEELFTFSMDGQPLPEKRLHVDSGIAMIVFNLTTTAGFPEASFQTSPVQWFETGPNGERLNNPVLTPGMFWVEKAAEQVVRLIDFNSNRSDLDHEKIHWFNVVVAYEGNTYGADPSIVNRPPD